MTTNTVKVKSIEFKGEIKGRGVVCYGSSDKNNHNRYCGKNYEYIQHDNYKLAACEWKKRPDGDGYHKFPIITSECLRFATTEDELGFRQTNNVLYNHELTIKYMSSLPALTKGYLFAKEGLKSKSNFHLTDAVDDGNAILKFDIHTRSGYKDTSTKGIDDSSDTTMYYRETCGATRYTFEGSISDINELRFRSMSTIFDRASIKIEHAGAIREGLKNNIAAYAKTVTDAKIGDTGDISEIGFYNKSGSAYDISELGFCLNDEQLRVLIHYILTRIASIRITKTTGGFAVVSEMQVRVITSPVKTAIDGDDGWITVKVAKKMPDMSFLNGLVFDDRYQFDSEGKYKEDAHTDAVKTRNAEAAAKNAIKREEKAAKKAENEAKKKAKTVES